MRLSPPSASRSLATFIMAALLLVVPSSMAAAGPILLSFDVTLDDGTATSDSGVAVVAGREIEFNNGTNVGDLLFDDEFIDLTGAGSLAYMIQGGLDDHPVASGYSTSWPAGTTLLFDNFVLDQPGTLASVGVTFVDKVVGAAGGGLVSGVDYVFTSNSLLLNIGSLGILEQQNELPLGLMTFQLNFVADEEPPNPVPDPGSSLMLFGISMAALAARLPRRRP